MAIEVEELVFKANTKDLERVEKKLRKLGKAANDARAPIEKTNPAIKQSARSFVKWGAAISAASVALVGMKLVNVQREFDVINSSLITVTGSTEAAAVAFEQIKQFASTTPFDLAQVSNAFVKLKALGLEPSEEALRSYGNTASAMGKDLNQMIEAVADAATGEFERLKEFGIKSASEGDRVKFTFRGVTTEVGKNADEIQGFLLGLGQTDFAGAMELRAATLDGAISNLGDAVDQLFLTISGTGVGSGMQAAVRGFTEFVSDIDFQIKRLSGTLSSGEAITHLEETIASIQDSIASAPQLAAAGINLNVEKALENIETLQAELAKLSFEEARPQIRSFFETPQIAEGDEPQTAFGDLTKSELDALQAKIDAEEILMEQRWEQQLAIDEAGANAAQAAMEERWENALTLEQTQRENMLRVAQDALDMENAAFAEAEEDKVRIAENTKDSMLAFSGMLLAGKSKDAQAAATIAVNLLNKEKMENAKQILSDSKSAAMKAWKALAGIPIIGPALGAAAAGTILAAGTAYAAQSLSGRALGGQVLSGESYVVGERGPEILTMGAGRGNITPNSSITNNAPVVNKTANVSFQIVANDTTGFDDLLQNRRGQIVGMINEALNNNGQEALA